MGCPSMSVRVLWKSMALSTPLPAWRAPPPGLRMSATEQRLVASPRMRRTQATWKLQRVATLLCPIIEDASNRVRLAKLLRFQTSKSDGKLVSLEQYVERMKEGQKSIYYITGESIDALKNSPFLEKLISKDFEVIYFTDPIDEYTMQNLTEFDDFKFSNASKEDLKFGDADDDEKARFKKTKEAFKSFTT